MCSLGRMIGCERRLGLARLLESLTKDAGPDVDHVLLVDTGGSPSRPGIIWVGAGEWLRDARRVMVYGRVSGRTERLKKLEQVCAGDNAGAVSLL
jgi:hypothetical protein